MKKIIMAMAVLINCSMIMAQTEFDALRVVQTDLNGTARYMGMAGAFGALGGDASAIKDNPAGLGIYRQSELVGTMNFMMQSSSSKWNGVNTISDSPYKSGFNNFSFVLASPTFQSESGNSGLQSSNFSFSYNRLKNLNRSLNMKSGVSASSMTDYMANFTNGHPEGDLSSTNQPYGNMNIPWLSVLAYDGYLINPIAGTNNWESLLAPGETVTPSYNLTEKGYVDEYSLGWAGNFGNTFYFGATANVLAVNYTAKSTYGESFANNGSMDLNSTVTSSGNGINLNIGAIVRPTNFLRVGLSLHTPTIYSMNENYYSNLNTNTDSIRFMETPLDGNNSFQIQSPMQLNGSVAFILGKKGIISAEYVLNNYTGTRYMDNSGDTKPYNFENAGMKNVLNDTRTIKIGGEFKLTDNFSLRAGYANTSNATKPDAEKLMQPNTIRTDTEYFINNRTDYMTAGFGYRDASWFIDFAYVNKILDESFMPYNSNALPANLAVAPASVITTTNNVVVTLGFKF